ncbi:hypothetical protein OF83DRAFT_942659 [Amylostereum chailletii]|nr:hypothetical protein OF83DRAFT_942659 [Amylostereum chailletii]
MSALTRREEETLFKTTKANALKQCDSIVKGTYRPPPCRFNLAHLRVSAFAECATGRTVSVAWACREKYRDVQDCMYQ